MTRLELELLDTISGGWMAQATFVAARLGVPDFLGDGSKTADQIAAATRTHEPSLRRLLRALVTLDLVRECEDGAFELTPRGALLRADAPNSLRATAIYWGEHLWPVWGNLLHSVETGESAMRLITGRERFDHLEDDPEAAAAFNRALHERTRLIAQDVVRAYDFSTLEKIVDVGGGYGQLLAAILAAAPASSGVLFDRPHAVAESAEHLEAAGVGSRCEVVAGDFFDFVPAGGDGYVLKSVLHDWDDERCRVILANCRRAMAADGRLLIVEKIVPERLQATDSDRAIARGDLHMLVAVGGRERTESEFRELLRSAGFEPTATIDTGTMFSIIEATPAS